MTITIERPAAFAAPSKETARRLARQQRQAAAAARKIAALRQKARAEIERLIDFIDATDQYASDEREEAVDDVPCDTDELEAEFATTPMEDRKPGDGCHWDGRDWLDGAEADNADDEPALGALENHPSAPPIVIGHNGPVWGGGMVSVRSSQGSQAHWGHSSTNDVEDEHDGAEPDVEDEGAPTGDDEPSLSWSEDVDQTRRGGDFGHQTATDMEACLPVVTPAARQRYKANRVERLCPNDDGRHVDVERALFAGGTRRIRNLSPRQKNLVRPRLDRDGLI